MLFRSPIAAHENWTDMVKNCLCLYMVKKFLCQICMVEWGSFSGELIRSESQRMKDCFMKELFTVSKYKDRNLWHSSFKAKLCVEDYVNFLNIKRCFCKVLIWNPRLIEQEIHKYLLCKEREKEVHFIMLCPACKEIRKKPLEWFQS